jgi:glycosyltransferase involved in cell wall biosynthesis
MMPTYNEIETLEAATKRLFEVSAEIDLLVIDDNSPDGTGGLADKLAAQNPRMHVLHRPGKNGLGKAYIAGMRWGLDHGFERLVQMDADGSHRPEDLHLLLQASAEFELVIGSRWVIGGAVSNWPWYRQGISQFGNWYAATMLKLELRDLTAGFRCYDSALLRRMDLGRIQAQGYGFQVEMTLRATEVEATICEVPILFIERENGRSKMTLKIVLEAFMLTTRWGLDRLFRR